MTTPVLVLIVPDAAHPAAHAEAAFSRYQAAGGFGLEVRSDRAAVLAAVRDSVDADRHLVIWDASAGMPPKEIEILVHGLTPGEWRAGTRRASLSVVRGGTGLDRVIANTTGGLRRAAGLSSESCPPCLAVPLAFVRAHIDRLSALSVSGWTTILLRAARREGIRVVEAPVMSAS